MLLFLYLCGLKIIFCDVMNKSKIYTRTGDTGMTSLVGGRRVKKSDVKVEAYGSVDTLNSYIGLLYADCRVKMPQEILTTLRLVSNKLFNLGAYLASDHTQGDTPRGLTDDDVAVLEHDIDSMDAFVPPLNTFVLPGGAHAACHAHVARSLCREAERRIIALSETGDYIAHVALNFVNRLSDYLFMLARYINVLTETPETAWNPEA